VGTALECPPVATGQSGGPVLAFGLPEGAVRTPAPVSYATVQPGSKQRILSNIKGAEIKCQNLDWCCKQRMISWATALRQEIFRYIEKSLPTPEEVNF